MEYSMTTPDGGTWTLIKEEKTMLGIVIYAETTGWYTNEEIEKNGHQPSDD